MQESLGSSESAAEPHVIAVVLKPIQQVCVLKRCPLAGLLQRDKQRRGMTNPSPCFLAEVTIVQLSGSIESEIHDALRSLGGFRELDCWQYWNVVIGFFLQRRRKAKLCQKRTSRGSGIAKNISERNKELATR